MWRLSALFIFLSLVTSVWLAYEMEIFSSSTVLASTAPKETGAEKPVATAPMVSGEAKKNDDKREAELVRREKEIGDREKLVANQMSRYEKLIDQLRAKINELEKSAQGRVDAFGKVYERMDPKKAARILNDLDVNIATQIVGGMKGDKAADVLSEMAPEKAKQITEKILNRRPASRSNSSEGVKSKSLVTGQ